MLTLRELAFYGNCKGNKGAILFATELLLIGPDGPTNR